MAPGRPFLVGNVTSTSDPFVLAIHMRLPSFTETCYLFPVSTAEFPPDKLIPECSPSFGPYSSALGAISPLDNLDSTGEY